MFVSLSCVHPGASTRGTWEWYSEGHEIYSPAFSPSGDEVVFVKKFHEPDGHEAEVLGEGKPPVIRSFDDTSRDGDPEVVSVDIGSGTLRQIGYGWEPVYSPDDHRIAFAFQTNPITGKRVLASALEGNVIQVFDRDSASPVQLSHPDVDYLYLSNPLFSPDASYLAYAFSDAINGAYGGEVGVGVVNLSEDGNHGILPPEKQHDLNRLVGPIYWDGDRIIVQRMTPMSGGTFLANRYDCELLMLNPEANEPEVIYSWGERKLDALRDLSYRVTGDGKVLLYDDSWVRLDPASKAVSPLKGGNRLSANSLISPDATLAFTVNEQKAEVREIKSGSVVSEFDVAGTFQSAAWSEDSDRIALVVTYFKDDDQFVFAFDKLIVLSLR
jgi:hypothetical protein